MPSDDTSPDAPSRTPASTDDLVVIGRIARPHGLKGEVRVFPETGSEELYPRIERFYIETSAGIIDLIPLKIRAANRYLIMRFEGYQGRDQADRLRGKTLWVWPEDLPELQEGDTYQYAQLGAAVFDEAGKELGTVEEIVDSPAHPILRIVGPDGEFLLPAVEEFIISFEVREGNSALVVRLPEGLLEAQRGSEEAEAT